jgi:hypothetical protein
MEKAGLETLSKDPEFSKKATAHEDQQLQVKRLLGTDKG